MKPAVSIIIPARNEQLHIGQTIASMIRAKTHATYELIVVDDGSTDGTAAVLEDLCRLDTALPLTVLRTAGLGAAPARNFGAARAQGNILVFCDAHLFVDDGWLDDLVGPLETAGWDAVGPGIAAHDRPDRVGYGQSLTEHAEVRWLPKPDQIAAVPILPGACLAVPVRVFRRIGGFDGGLRTWGMEDIELSVRMWLFGYRLGVTPHTVVRHVFRKSHPYPVRSYDYSYNVARTALSHFSGPRLARFLAQIANHPMRFDLLTTVLTDGTLERRHRLLASRVRDDDWFVREFGLPWDTGAANPS